MPLAKADLGKRASKPRKPAREYEHQITIHMGLGSLDDQYICTCCGRNRKTVALLKRDKCEPALAQAHPTHKLYQSANLVYCGRCARYSQAYGAKTNWTAPCAPAKEFIDICALLEAEI